MALTGALSWPLQGGLAGGEHGIQESGWRGSVLVQVVTVGANQGTDWGRV